MGQKDTIPALERAIQLIHAVADGKYFHSIAQLSRELGFPQTTCYRIIRTLMDADWVRPRGHGTGYELSFGLLPLFKPFDSHRVLLNAIRPAVEDLVHQTGFSAKVSVRQGCDAVTIFRADSQLPIALTSRLGAHFHLAYGSSGAVLLSEMSDWQIQKILDTAPVAVWKYQTKDDVWRRIRQCRRDGWCLDAGGYSPQVHTVSALLSHHQPVFVGALTLLGIRGELDKQRKLITDRVIACVACCRDAMSKTENQDSDHEDH